MRTIGFVVMICASILIFGGVNYYIGLRSWQGIGGFIPFISNKVYWIIFWGIALSFIIARVGSKFLPLRVEALLSLLGSYWMAAILYLLILLPSIDIIRFAMKRTRFIASGIRDSTFIKNYFGIIIFIFLIGILVYGTWNAKSIKVAQYNIDIQGKSSNIEELKIVMISDLHLGNIVNNSRLLTMVEKINDLHPDIVLIAGDIIDDSIKPFIRQNMGETFKKLKTKYGVFAATGNHDYYGGDVEELINNLESSGVNVLTDKYIEINDSFVVVGREDIAVESYYKRDRKKVSDILSDDNKKLPIILIDHTPKNLQEPMENGVDLQVSGHTHRGQMFPSRYITERLFEVDWGYLKKDNLNVVVSSGIGTWGPPIRIGNSSEIVEINLRFIK
ncbi:metallophosphoesterase [Clostridium sp.]|uniref:metallophosphoesterase n=1 Tax=Clostridium sp. TaxID=1506 RepID=UPI00261C7527|nr:metallophosphoesterase [Clostridium sp.]